MLRETLARQSSISSKVALIAVFTSMALATNYAMIDIPNVKLMDSFVFIAAFLFGIEVGLATGTSIWLVYGFVNPNGIDTLLLLAFLMVGECFYAIAGALLRRTASARRMMTNGYYAHSAIMMGTVGLLTTFAYDVLTNFGDKLQVISSPYQALIVGVITGVPFALTHEISNIFFFGTIVPSALFAAKRFGVEAV